MRRTIGIIVSVALVGIGALLLVAYVRGAEERALAGEELVGVYVVDHPVAQGAAADEVIDALRVEQVPVKVAADGGVESLDEIEGLVTNVDLVPGEQVLTSRFVDPAEMSPYSPIDLPDDLLQVTVSLSPDRALGGALVPGDTVAVIASFDPFEVRAVEPGTEEPIDLGDGTDIYIGSTEDGDESGLRTPNSTHLIMGGVLVTNVQVERLPTEGDTEGAAPALAPTGNLLVTLAASPAGIEKIIFTMEHGFLWLAGEGSEARILGTEIQTRGTIYR
jgi:pilus assembly protein CpaB